MIITLRWIDVSPHLAAKQQPVILLERPLLHGNDTKGGLFSTAEVARVGKHWAANGPLVGADVDPAWRFTREGTHVRVPVNGYVTTSRAKSQILATGLEIGIRAMVSYRQRTPEEPQELILILGHQVDDLHDEGRDNFRCYVGVAVRTE
jgi:hypothetical protein